jgi:hypothetical protein
MGTPMAFTTGTTYTYTDRIFKRGTIGLNLPSTLAPGYNWFNGVDVTSSQYLIYSDTYTTGQATQANSRPTAWTTPDKTDASLLGLINTLPERIGQTSFTNVTDARTWLQESNRYFLINSGYEDIVTSGLTLSWDAAWYNSFKTGNTLWYDISGSYVNGTFTNGPSFSTSNGGSISFDGTDDYVSASVSSPGPPITVETICRFNNVDADSGNYRYAFSLGNNVLGQMISLSKAATTNPAGTLQPNQGYVYLGGGQNDGLKNINYIFTGSAYHHVVIQVLSDNQTIKCYIDGVDVGVQSNTQTISLGTTLNLGRWFNNSWYFNGNIQTFRIYNRVLSQAEILKNYNAQKGRIGYDNIISSGLKLNLNSQIQLSYSGGGNKWYDLSGNNRTGTLTNGPTFDSTTRSVVFDGVDDVVYVSDTNTTYNSLTFTALINVATQSPGAGIVFNRSGGGNTTGMNILYPSANGIGYHWNDDPNTYGYNPGLTLPNNRWCFCCVSVSPTQAIFQINNNVVVRSYTNVNPNTTIGGNLQVGADAVINRYYQAKIANAGMYSRALTQTEILQNYYQGNVVTNGLVLALDAGNLVSYGGTGTNWYDLTTNANNGTLVNGPTYSTLNGGNLIFDGTNDYVTTTITRGSLGNTMSIEAYFKYTGADSRTYSAIIGGYESSGSGTEFFLGKNTGNTYFGIQDGNYRPDFVTTNYVFDGNFHHIVYTYNNGTGTLFIDGIQRGQNSFTKCNDSEILYIGNEIESSGYYWPGSIPVVRFYNKVLSAMEVQQNFNANRGRYGI